VILTEEPDDDRYKTLSSSLVVLSVMLRAEFEDLRKEVERNLKYVDSNPALLAFLLTTMTRSLGVDAFSGIQTSMVGRALEPTYDACSHESGRKIFPESF
jgi:hypothetical protein